MERIVSTERWLDLAARGGAFTSSRYGFTPRAETAVWGWRSLDEHLFYFCLHGGFHVVFPDMTIEMTKGSFIWIMANVHHETRLLPGRKSFRNYYVRFNLAEETTPVRLAADVIHVPDAWHLLTYLRDLVHELQSPQQFHDHRLHGSLLSLSAAALSNSTHTQRAVLTGQQRLRLLSYINAKINDASVEEMATEVGLSTPYFRRIFHRSYGMTPKHWIVRQRIMLAAIIMSETELTAKEVAHRLGYCDRFLFSRQFKEVMGVPARQFRRGAGAEPQWDHIADDMTSSLIRHTAIAQSKRTQT